MTYGKAFQLIAATWAYSAIPMFFCYSKYGGMAYHRMFHVCTVNWKLGHYLFIPLLTVYNLVLPFGILSVSYSKIVLHVRATRAAVQKLGTGQKSNKSDANLFKTFTILLVTYLAFLTLWAYLSLFGNYNREPKLLWLFGVHLLHGNSINNSFIYAATNKRFRDGYKYFLQRLFCCSKSKR